MAIRKKRWSYGFKIRWSNWTFRFGCGLSETMRQGAIDRLMNDRGQVG
jgi:hypothetical protein